MLRVVTAVVVLLSVCVALGVDGSVWRSKTNQDETVQRVVALLRGPQGAAVQDDHDVLAFAGRRNTRTQDGDGIFWHWTTNYVPRKASLYIQRRANDDDSDPEGNDFSAAAIFLRWALWSLVEYIPTSANGFNPASDLIVQKVRLYGLPESRGGQAFWSPITRTKGEITNKLVGREVEFCTTRSGNNTSPASSLEVEICVRIVAERFRFSMEPLEQDPNSVKWSLRVRNWPWASPETKLALKSSFDSAQADTIPDNDEQADLENDDQDGLVMGRLTDGDNTITALLAYRRNLTYSGGSCVGGIDRGRVIRSVVNSGEWTTDVDFNDASIANNYGIAGLSVTRQARVTYFTFETAVGDNCQPNDILWDPELGISTPELPLSSGVFSAPLIVVTLTSALVALLA